MICRPVCSPVGRSIGRSVFLTSGTGAPASTLLDGLISWWPMNEASGTRFDVHGANHLTANNSVGSAAGKVSAAASMVHGSSEHLSAIVDRPAEWTLAFWMKYASGAAYDSPWGWGADNMEKSGANWGWRIAQGDPANVNMGAATTNWEFWAFATDADGSYWSKNGAAWTSAGGAKAPTGSGLTLSFAVRADINSLTYVTMLQDEALLSGRKLTDAELVELFNGGDGIAYPG